MRKYLILAIIAFALILSLSSCAYFTEPGKINGGEKLNEELLSEIRDEIFGSGGIFVEDEIENEKQDGFVSGEIENNDTVIENVEGEETVPSTVYWSPNGSVWHIDKTCRYLKNSNTICEGTVDEAKNEGKEHMCSTCDKK